MNKYNSLWSALPLVVILTACGGGGGGGGGSSSSGLTSVPETPSGDVSLSGTVTFEHVPLNTLTNGLDYSNSTEKPARGIVIELLDSAGDVLQSTVTDSLGLYNFSVAPETQVQVRVRAQMKSETGALWDISVTDNTNSNAPYLLLGGLLSAGAEDSARDFYAPSGWDGSAYSSDRAAAPFAILDPIYTGVESFVAIDPDIDFGTMQFRWSPNNTSTLSGDVPSGAIGTSYYQAGNVYVLGDADAGAFSDTDEYDAHVVVHEWGHYLEDNLFVSDSIGGMHGGTDKLDARVAFGEGFGNALSGIILGDPVYRDSNGVGQSTGFSNNVENNAYMSTGWYSEGSVQSLIYDLYDDDNDGMDKLSLGLGPIYEVLSSEAYKTADSFTSIYPFAHFLKAELPADSAVIDTMMMSQNIHGTGINGDGETNDGGLGFTLPVYKALTVGGASVNICSYDDEAGTANGNKHGNRAWASFDIASAATYTITMNRISGDFNRDPDFYIYKDSEYLTGSISGVTDSETWTGTLAAGSYILDAYDDGNFTESIASAGDSCFSLSVTP